MEFAQGRWVVDKYESIHVRMDESAKAIHATKLDCIEIICRCEANVGIM